MYFLLKSWVIFAQDYFFDMPINKGNIPCRYMNSIAQNAITNLRSFAL